MGDVIVYTKERRGKHIVMVETTDSEDHVMSRLHMAAFKNQEEAMRFREHLEHTILMVATNKNKMDLQYVNGETCKYLFISRVCLVGPYSAEEVDAEEMARNMMALAYLVDWKVKASGLR